MVNTTIIVMHEDGNVKTAGLKISEHPAKSVVLREICKDLDLGNYREWNLAVTSKDPHTQMERIKFGEGCTVIIFKQPKDLVLRWEG